MLKLKLNFNNKNGRKSCLVFLSPYPPLKNKKNVYRYNQFV